MYRLKDAAIDCMDGRHLKEARLTLTHLQATCQHELKCCALHGRGRTKSITHRPSEGTPRPVVGVVLSPGESKVQSA